MIGKESTNAFPDEMHFNIFVLLSLFLNCYPVASCYSVRVLSTLPVRKSSDVSKPVAVPWACVLTASPELNILSPEKADCSYCVTSYCAVSMN